VATRDNVGEAVLSFYKALPFNMRADASMDAEVISRLDVVAESYPMLADYLAPGKRVLEVGCGTGWLCNSMAFHYRADVTGLDFNAVATERARETARVLAVDARFVTGDFYQYVPDAPFDVVVSNGVLHHTHDAIAGLERLLSRCVVPGGVVLIGLYHLFGRKPFLDHFRQMRENGASEDELVDRYAQLHPQIAEDRTHLMSWYRDQVCHPHETQHTLAEMMPVLERNGFDLKSTSINRFAPISDLNQVLDMESALETVGQERLLQIVYFAGYFLFLAKRRP
jgi:SAM-dependent methyltransferase